MTARGLASVLERFSGHAVLLIGESVLDCYIEGASGRICREAPVPVVEVRHKRAAPGGAANTAVNLQALGAKVQFLSLVGADPDGHLLRATLRAHGVSNRYLLTVPTRHTLAKRRVAAESQLLVRFDEGDQQPIDGATEQALGRVLQRLYPRADAVVVSDYGLGLLTPGLIQLLAELQAEFRKPLVVDSKRLALYRGLHPTVVKPNYEEARRLLDLPADPPEGRPEQMAHQAEALLEATGARVVAVTLDRDGAVILERDRAPYRTFGRPVAAARAAGAGDAFIAGFALALASEADIVTGAEIAAAAATVAVGRDGTACCPFTELTEFFSPDDKYLQHRSRLAARAEMYRHQGRRIVFTNGCFDILHRGHVTYLSRAKSLGDVLIVGVNSDSSVRRLKGPERPVNPLEDRIEVLAALSCVDHIVSFDEDTASELIDCIRPDVFAKGGDYAAKDLPEAPLVEALGGKVLLLPYLEDQSTTKTLERIRRPDTNGPFLYPAP
ncbi:MAG TPA: D-glycero-beta-D-manno-heptose 1-phosphate adenylyltransferase [Acidiferrobacteraceae bacterium]|nr:D-glycero-beta-D-manno-heptose 1-phosphate adenylyltransferase [Acidiferrobacteraceae bacterium]